MNLVVAVGSAATWSTVLGEIQSTYNPPWIATNEVTLASTSTGTTKTNPKYLANVLSSTPTPPTFAIWKEPSIQKCLSIIKKAYPKDKIAAPTATSTGANDTFQEVLAPCQNLALISAIAKAAGKNLTVKSFTRRGLRVAERSHPRVRQSHFVCPRTALRRWPRLRRDLRHHDGRAQVRHEVLFVSEAAVTLHAFDVAGGVSW